MRFIPLGRIVELETALTELMDSPRRETRRDAIAVALGLHGCRVNEVAMANFGQLQILNQQIHIPKFKRGLARDLPLHESLLDALGRCRADFELPRHANAPLLATKPGRHVCYTQFERFAKSLTERVLGEGLKFHALRHTFATRVYAETGDVLLCKKLMGHRSINSTMVYVEAVKSMPESCQVRVNWQLRFPGQQLRLFDPTADAAG